MAAKLAVEPASIGRLTGMYTDENDKSKTLEFFKQGNSLWLKNEVFGVDLEYIDNNKFQPRGTPEQGLTYIFEILPTGPVKLTYPIRNNGKIDYSVAMNKRLAKIDNLSIRRSSRGKKQQSSALGVLKVNNGPLSASEFAKGSLQTRDAFLYDHTLVRDAN